MELDLLHSFQCRLLTHKLSLSPLPDHCYVFVLVGVYNEQYIEHINQIVCVWIHRGVGG